MSMANFDNSNPLRAVPPNGINREVILREFAKRLQNAMLERGWNQSEMARQAARFTADGKFGRDNISNYVRALVLPGPTHLNALVKALDIKPEELLPARAYQSVDNKTPALDLKDLGSGKALVRMNMTLSWDDAIRILQIAKGQ